MATSPPESPPAPPAPVAFDLTLDEACLHLSGVETSVEMVAGFHADERAKGRIKDSLENFSTRFEAFKVRPVA